MSVFIVGFVFLCVWHNVKLGVIWFLWINPARIFLKVIWACMDLEKSCIFSNALCTGTATVVQNTVL
jgi:hypothetical protein